LAGVARVDLAGGRYRRASNVLVRRRAAARAASATSWPTSRSTSTTPDETTMHAPTTSPSASPLASRRAAAEYPLHVKRTTLINMRSPSATATACFPDCSRKSPAAGHRRLPDGWLHAPIHFAAVPPPFQTLTAISNSKTVRGSSVLKQFCFCERGRELGCPKRKGRSCVRHGPRRPMTHTRSSGCSPRRSATHIGDKGGGTGLFARSGGMNHDSRHFVGNSKWVAGGRKTARAHHFHAVSMARRPRFGSGNVCHYLDRTRSRTFRRHRAIHEMHVLT
jgi:hypothetical protein